MAFFNRWKSKLIVPRVCLNLVWSLQDGLWNSMQCSCTEIGNGTVAHNFLCFLITIFHLAWQRPPPHETRWKAFHISCRKATAEHLLGGQLLFGDDTVFITHTEDEFQDLCIIFPLVYDCFGINTNLKRATIKTENVLAAPGGSNVNSLWISVVGWLLSVLGRQLQYSATWLNSYGKTRS